MKKSYMEKETVKDWMAESLIQLSQTIPFHKITVTEITTKAGVPRSTFYRYYYDKEDVLSQYFAFLIECFSYECKQNPPGSLAEYLTREFSFYRQYTPFFQTLKRCHLEYIMFDHVSDTELYPQKKLSDKETVKYFAISVMSIMYDWIVTGSDLNAEQLADLILGFSESDQIKGSVEEYMRIHTNIKNLTMALRK